GAEPTGLGAGSEAGFGRPNAGFVPASAVARASPIVSSCGASAGTSASCRKSGAAGAAGDTVSADVASDARGQAETTGSSARERASPMAFVRATVIQTPPVRAAPRREAPPSARAIQPRANKAVVALAPAAPAF